METRTVQVNRNKQIPSIFFETVTRDMIQKMWHEIEHSLDVSRATNGAHIEMYEGKSKTLNFSEHFKTPNV